MYHRIALASVLLGATLVATGSPRTRVDAPPAHLHLAAPLSASTQARAATLSGPGRRVPHFRPVSRLPQGGAHLDR